MENIWRNTILFLVYPCGGIRHSASINIFPESCNTPDDSERPINEDTKVLVVYFSVPDNQDNSYVEIDGERLRNTQYMAYIIQENT